jgi:predicted nucleic acid-binding Zn ribbon protein
MWKPGGSMRRVKDVLPGTLRTLGIARRTREAQALMVWRDVVGPVLASETEPLHLRGSTLWVRASSTALAHQLHIEKPQLLKGLNDRIGSAAVRDIRFLQGMTGR